MNCCSPSRDADDRDGGEDCTPRFARGAMADSVAPGESTASATVELEGGAFLMGHDRPDGYPEDVEGPARVANVAPFAVDTVAVTNAAFAEFVSDTGHHTDAERFGWSFVFARFLPDDAPATRGVAGAEWWRQVFGADWQHPDGPWSDLDGRETHPVVHVSWRDADAYARWAGKRLPSEAEWEYAARGGLVQCRFPWGDELEPGGEHRMNVWQGVFPRLNTLDDGFAGTAPVRSYPPNAYGLYEMTGNVWEWTGSWFDASHQARAMRGGSYLCHASYCSRYRVDSRSSNSPDSSAGNLGFRCAR
jgi:formylglycine-generating enzyme